MSAKWKPITAWQPRERIRELIGTPWDLERAVEASYAATHARLADNPEYQALKTAADNEARDTPDRFIDRNRFAIYIEINTPPD